MAHTAPRRSNSNTWAKPALVVMAALVAVVIVLAIVRAVGVESDLGPEVGVTADEVAASDSMDGREVTISAAIDTVVAPRLFELFSEEGTVLVLATTQPHYATADLRDELDTGDVAVASGTVRMFDHALADDHDLVWRAAMDRYVGEPVILAHDVRLVSGPGEGGIAGDGA